MPRTCTVCSHENRTEIDLLIVNRTALRTISDRFGVSKTALIRHGRHISQAVRDAGLEATVAPVLQQINELQQTTLGILKKAEKAKDLRVSLMAIREARANIEVIGKLTGGEPTGQRPEGIVWVDPEEPPLPPLVIEGPSAAEVAELVKADPKLLTSGLPDSE